MAPRVVLPPKKNRARCGIKYPLRIVLGDLGPECEYTDDYDLEENSSLIVAEVERTESNEHHLQAALATKAAFIPTPGAIRIVDSYEELYPPNRWKDPVSYLKTTQTVEEACSNGLVDHEFTYYMDEMDKQWLDKNNQEARGEGTSAQGARQGKDKSPEIGVPVSISDNEFELVMGLLEKVTEQGLKGFEGDGPDFSSYQHFFLEPLPADTFASYVTPSWIPPPALLVRIARTVYPHWQQRRALLKGRRIRPILNFDEFDALNESYVCFTRRDRKAVRKTRAGQVLNNADKLVQIQQNLSQALDIANTVLMRENVKQAAAVQSHNVWRARQPMADMLRRFPSFITKVDEERLLDKPKKTKPPRASLPKVKVLPPTNPGTPAPGPASGQTIQPSERSAAIEQEVTQSVQRELQDLKNNKQVDVLDDPYQPSLIPRAEKMWVDVPPLFPSQDLVPSPEAPTVRGGRAVRLRFGRGGRRLLDRRSGPHPYLAELPNHRDHAGDDPDDEETVRRLRGQWRFDADCGLFGPPEEENRELVDEYGIKYQAARMRWATKAEAALVTDASLIVQRPDGPDMRILPEQFLANALHVQGILEKPTLTAYLAEEGIIPTSALASARGSPMSTLRAMPIHQRAGPSSPAPPHSRGGAQAPPSSPAPSHPRAQASPVSSAPHPRVQASPASSTPHPRAQTPMRPPSSPAAPRMQENISPKPGSAPSSPSVHATARPHARTHTLLHNPNPIASVPNGDAFKVGGSQSAPVNVNVNAQRHSPVHSQPNSQPQAHPLQTNGLRTAGPAYVPLNAGTNMSLKLPASRVPRPSPLATHSVVASQIASSSPSRASESQADLR
ncbi:hypothetical protein DFH06DRAFT_628510 [Mycena polygramma]|nr:hypothetical protein DFH06DRAFT_628510 [Mycena polygramma]